MLTDYTPIAATFSKDPSFWGAKFPIHHIKRGSASSVLGNDNNWYVDWVSGLGAILLGYSNEYFDTTLRLQIAHGIGFSLPHYNEYAAAELLTSTLRKHIAPWNRVPLQVRWVKSGSDACNTAIRMARAITGRTTVHSYGYHGWADTFVGLTPPAHGITKQDIKSFDFNFLPELDQNSACVILEQGLEQPLPNYYDDLRAACTKNGTLLIMDEVVTGLRYGLGGATALHGVVPDMICLGKALGNGMPIAAVVAPIEHMSWFDRDDPVFVSSTNAGDALSLASVVAVLGYILSTPGFYYDLRATGIALIENIKSTVGVLPGARLSGDPERSLLTFDSKPMHAAFMYHMAKGGVLMNRPNFPNAAHGEQEMTITKKALEYTADKLAEMSKSDLKAWEPYVGRTLFTNR